MFTRLGHLAVRRRGLLVAVTVVFLGVAGVIGGGVFDKLSSGGFEDPAAESTRAAELLKDEFDAGAVDLVMVVRARRGGVDDRPVAQAGAELTATLARHDGVAQAISYWSAGRPPPLKSEDGDKALALLRLAGDEDQVDATADAIVEEFEGDRGPISVGIGGTTQVFNEVAETIETDLARAESIALPVTLVLLVVIFGSVVAALLPLAVGVLAILGTFLSLSLIASVTEVSVFSINLTTALGLGLAIDYSLLVVSRFREELAAGLEPDAALVRTVETAGRTVAFSALTVAISLAALLVFPLYFLRSFAYAGIAVVLMAAVASLISLPAVLALLGRRVDKLQLWRRRPASVGEGFWHKVATSVMRRPVSIATVVIVLLLALGAPFLDARFALPDERVLPAEAPARRVSEELARDFASNEGDAFGVVVAVDGPPARRTEDIAAFAERVSRDRDVSRVDALTGSYVQGRRLAPPTETSVRFAGEGHTWFNVVPKVEPVSPEGEALITRVRSIDAPFPVWVGGDAAGLADTKAAIYGGLPLAGVIIGLTTFVLLFLMFGSLLVPAKAVVLNLLSLTATFGAMVWVFQDGNGAGLLDFEATGTLDVNTPILMFCIAFGLSMDYEVFLLSRIKEEHDRSGDNTGAVALGLERTGRIVTAAALVLSVTFLAFSTSHITFIKLFGIGLTLAVVMDATLIRATLVPAFMRLAGEANWWAPAPLRRLYQRFGISET
ncbi:MAG: MMPL family transporter [Actinomycetota bacterium]